MSERYTHGHDDAVLRSHRWRTAQNSAAYLLDVLTPGMSVLDIGCGPGTITHDLAAAVAPGPVVGVDRSSDVVTAAAGAHRADNLSFAVGDVYALDHGDDTFDVVHAHQVLQHLSEPVRALQEMRRVCRPGGFVAVREADFSAMSWWPRIPALDRWREIYDAVARANGGEPDAARNLRRWAIGAGFDDVTWSASAWCFASDEDRQWWARTWADRITATAIAERAVEIGAATRDELQACADAWLTWMDAPGAGFVVAHGEILARP